MNATPEDIERYLHGTEVLSKKTIPFCYTDREVIEVIIIDDDARFLESLRIIMSAEESFSITEFKSINEAIEMLKSKKIDAIICDHQMPDMNGIEFLKILRQSGYDIPFILVTEKGNEEIAIEALNNGADYYLRKGAATSSQIVELYERIKHIVSQRRMEERNKFYAALFKSIINRSPGIIMVTDSVGIIIFVSQSIRQLGYEPEDIVQKKITAFLNEDEMDILRSTYKEILSNPGKPKMIVIRMKSALDEWRYFGATVYFEPAYDLLFMSLIDITRFIKMSDAKRKMNKKLKLLMSITRHDILNQLTALNGYIELLGTYSGDKSNAYMEKIESIVKRMERHVLFTREIEKIGEEPAQWMNLYECIEKSFSLLELKEIDVEVDDDIKNIEIFADPTFQKVIYNLIDNTLSHARNATRISIRVEIGTDLSIIYEDDGCGIPDEIRENLFTYNQSRGSYGLFLVKEILELNDMDITEEGPPGKGVKFIIKVPTHLWRFVRKREQSPS